MWEDYPWKISTEMDIHADSTAKPCKHCRKEFNVTMTRSDGTTYVERHWICPRVVIAYNEGNCNSTGVCLDCILEAAKVFPADNKA